MRHVYGLDFCSGGFVGLLVSVEWTWTKGSDGETNGKRGIENVWSLVGLFV